MRYEPYYGMKKLSRPAMVVVTSLCLFLAATVMPDTKMHASTSDPLAKAGNEPAHARGTFEVVPDSGAGQLVGLAGTLDIKIVEGKHFYDLEYTLPKAP